MKVGFAGLGNLGGAMAKRLISENVELIVWNRTTEKAGSLGVGIAANPAELVSKTDIVFLNLTDSVAVQAVLTAEDGLLSGDCSGKTIIDTTTNHFDSVISFADIVGRKGAFYLESPVMGSVMPALQGNLTILVSGPEAVFNNVRPILEKLGKKIYYFGKPGLATKMKLVNNLCLATFMGAIAEALTFGEAAGAKKEDVIDLLANGAANSPIMAGKRDKLMNEDYSPHFSSAMMYKDLGYLQDLSKSLKKPLFFGGLAKEIFALTFAKNIENLDFSAVYKIMKEY